MFQRWIANLRSWFDRTPEEMIDPEVDIRTTIDEARRRDQDLRNEAAKAIADKIRLDSEIRRAATLVAEAEEMAKHALLLAEEANAAGDEAEVAMWLPAAESLSVRVRAADDDLTSLKSQYEKTVARAEQAKDAVRAHAVTVQQWSAQHLEKVGSADRAQLRATLDDTVQAMFTSIADEGPDLEALQYEIEQHRATGKTKDSPPDASAGAGGQGLTKTVNIAEADAKLDEIRRDLDL